MIGPHSALRCLSLVMLAALLWGCDSSGPDLPRAPSLDVPRITGIERRDASNHHLGYLGQPAPSPDPAPVNCAEDPPDSPDIGLPSSLVFGTPYPNPNAGGFTVRFVLPCATRAELWLVRGLGPGETVDDLPSVAGALTAMIGGVPSLILIDELLPEGGYYAVVERTDRLPVGFYRIYLKAGGALTWRDAWIVDSALDPPRWGTS